jgi:hypothetical protein
MCWGSRRLVIARWGGAGVELEEAQAAAVWMELHMDEALAVEVQQEVDGESTDLESAGAEDQA